MALPGVALLSRSATSPKLPPFTPRTLGHAKNAYYAEKRAANRPTYVRHRVDWLQVVFQFVVVGAVLIDREVECARNADQSPDA
jgi:hypothetical protein